MWFIFLVDKASLQFVCDFDTRVNWKLEPLNCFVLRGGLGGPDTRFRRTLCYPRILFRQLALFRL
jgi:hypothetical protein